MRSLIVGALLAALTAGPSLACVEEGAAVIITGRLQSIRHGKAADAADRQIRPDTPFCVQAPFGRRPSSEATRITPADGVAPTRLADEAHVRVIGRAIRDDGVNLAVHYTDVLDID